ncbi:hypothetical protein A140_02345 [Vibrio crassostreae 9ZC88]|nr:hypothetical protein A140_02345 [Vibrio crassostreae 9ZC88]
MPITRGYKLKLIKLLNINVQRVVSFFFVILMIVSSIYMAVNDKEMAASICILSFSIGIAFINLDKFSIIKAAGFEARLKDAVDEAYTAIDELKAIAINVSKPTISLLAVRDAFAYLPLDSKLTYARGIAETLKELKVEESEATEILSTLYDRVEEEHRQRILHAINEKLEDSDPRKVKDFYSIDMNEWPIPRLNSLSSELEVDIEELLEAHRYFVENKALKVPEDWQG